MIFEELEFEFTNILIAIGSIIIIYFAWKSTNVEDRLPHTAVLVIENNRRRLLENIVRPQIQINQNPRRQLYSNSSEISEVQQNQNVLNNIISTPAPSLQEVIDEVNDLAISGPRNTSNNIQTVVTEEINDLLEEDSDPGPQQIIQNMDNPEAAESLRRRRLAFYNQDENNLASSSSSQPLRRENLNFQTDVENCSNENNENENISKNESSRIRNDNTPLIPEPSAPPEELINEEFRIKLKYLNDDLRLVKGSPNEAIGDFKKRNFNVELSSDKLVRLVFNGHVLQPDSKTLQACGLFDNCVVHCLIHKKPANVTDQNNRNENIQRVDNGHQGIRNNGANGIGVSVSFLDTNANGPMFVYFGIAMVSLAIVFCWYCRIQYSSLFSLYSTCGLVLLTAIFLIIFPLVVLIERDVST